MGANLWWKTSLHPSMIKNDGCNKLFYQNQWLQIGISQNWWVQLHPLTHPKEGPGIGWKKNCLFSRHVSSTTLASSSQHMEAIHTAIHVGIMPTCVSVFSRFHRWGTVDSRWERRRHGSDTLVHDGLVFTGREGWTVSPAVDDIRPGGTSLKKRM